MSLHAVRALVRKEILEQARSHRLLATMLLFLFFGLASPLLARYMPEMMAGFTAGQGLSFQVPDPTWRDAAIQYVKNLSQVCLFVLIFLTMGTVASEKERGTAACLLSKPVARPLFLASKLAASWAVATAAMALSGLGCWFYAFVLFSEFPALPFLTLNGAMLLYVFSVTALTLCCSTLMKSQAAAGILSFLAWFLMAGLAAIPGLGEFLPPRLADAGLAAMTGAAVSWKPFAGAAALIGASTAAAVAALRRWEP